MLLLRNRCFLASATKGRRSGHCKPNQIIVHGASLSLLELFLAFLSLPCFALPYLTLIYITLLLCLTLSRGMYRERIAGQFRAVKSHFDCFWRGLARRCAELLAQEVTLLISDLRRLVCMIARGRPGKTF
jgi:hypothetical protein